MLTLHSIDDSKAEKSYYTEEDGTVYMTIPQIYHVFDFDNLKGESICTELQAYLYKKYSQFYIAVAGVRGVAAVCVYDKDQIVDVLVRFNKSSVAQRILERGLLSVINEVSMGDDRWWLLEPTPTDKRIARLEKQVAELSEENLRVAKILRETVETLLKAVTK